MNQTELETAAQALETKLLECIAIAQGLEAHTCQLAAPTASGGQNHDAACANAHVSQGLSGLYAAKAAFIQAGLIDGMVMPQFGGK